MRKVVDAANVAHLWANKVQDEARTPTSNLYFYGNNIYSYGTHFLIAAFIKNEAGKEVVLMTDRIYSKTTSKQQSLTLMAIRHLDVIYCHDAMYSKADNFKAWLNEIITIAHNLKGARKPEKYLAQIASVYNKVKLYAEFWGVEIPAEITEFNMLGDGKAYGEALKQKAKADKIKKDAKLAEVLTNWRNFEFTGYFSNPTGYDFLRFNEVAQRVETSQQIQIPADIAKLFYKLVLRTIDNGGCTNCNEKLLYYNVNEINAKFIRVGCHKIEIKEIKALTEKLGW